LHQAHRTGQIPAAVRPLVSLALALAALAAAGGNLAHAHPGLDELAHALDTEVVRHPENAEVRLQRANVQLLERHWRAALAELAAALTYDADRDVVGTMRGRVLLEAGKARAARAELDRVLRRRPDAYGTLFERGRAWLALGDAQRAADDFGRAIEGLKTPRPEQVIARRDALMSLGKQADAVRALDEGMARIGHVASLELAAIDLEAQMGHHEHALTRIDRLLAATPQNPAWVALRAELLQRTGRSDEARADYGRALAMIETRPAGRRGRAFEDLRRHLQTALADGAPEGN
jgi:tetratricopeptide (TPR) repeat protein